jgi:uncharacterized membrane protein
VRTHLSLDRRHIFVAILLLLSAAALRLPSLTLNGFWYDELYTARVTLIPFKAMAYHLLDDVHPPLFNVLVYLWSLVFGTSEFMLRMLPALFGVITALISFLVFRKPFGSITAFANSVLIIFWPIHIYYSQELRSYSLSFLLATVATGTLFRYLEKPTGKWRWLLATTCAVLFATHYISIFYITTLLSVGFIGVSTVWRRKLVKGMRLGIATFLLMGPSLPHFLYKRSVMGQYWPSPVTFDGVKNTISWLFIDIRLFVLYLLMIIISIIFVWYKRDRADLLRMLNLSALSILPLTGVIMVSLISPHVTVLIPRIMLVFAPPIIMLAAISITSIPIKVFTTITLLLVSVGSIWWLYHNAYYTVPTKGYFRDVTREVARLQREYSEVLWISLDYQAITQIGEYYYKMFGVQSSDILVVPDNMTDNELLQQIHMVAMQRKVNKIVLFYMAAPRNKRVVELCNRHFQNEDKRVFDTLPGNTFVASYSLAAH